MPQIDFGQAFAVPKENGTPAVEDLRLVPLDSRANQGEEIMPLKSRRFRLKRSDWVDLTFAMIAVLGGFICAFYIYDGGEFLRAAAVWPRELFDLRPSIGLSELSPSHVATSLDLALPKSSAFSNDRSGDPFSRIPGSLSLVTRGAKTSWSLSQLDFPAPGGDELMQTFTHGVVDRGRVARLDTRRSKAGLP